MRIGVMIGGDGRRLSIDDVVGLARQVESAGLDDVWMANIFSFDAISTLALVGREVPRIGLGTAVTPTFPRHPTAIAQQALTTAAATSMTCCRAALACSCKSAGTSPGFLPSPR